MEAQFLEIYNEILRDLLSSSQDATKKHEIKHVNGITTVTDATSSRIIYHFILMNSYR